LTDKHLYTNLAPMTKKKDISFVIPVYNEELNIANVLNDLHEVLRIYPSWNSEVVVIEDGSSDQTRSIIQACLKSHPETSLITHDSNQGYTRSLKDGISKSQGRFIMYVGADEEFDCSEIPSFIGPLLRGETDVVLGVRWQRNAYQLFRFFLSVIYIFLLNYLFKMRINDYNWSQAWSRDLLQKITLDSNSLFVLPEIIIKAHDLKYRIKEVPSNHRGRQHGKSSVNIKIMAHALSDAFQFALHRKSQLYAPNISDNQSMKSVTK
jgi:glycosyltransferase involved in cell wall biosynthesis